MNYLESGAAEQAILVSFLGFCMHFGHLLTSLGCRMCREMCRETSRMMERDAPITSGDPQTSWLSLSGRHVAHREVAWHPHPHCSTVVLDSLVKNVVVFQRRGLILQLRKKGPPKERAERAGAVAALLLFALMAVVVVY